MLPKASRSLCALASVSLALGACADDSPSQASSDKGEIDRDALSSGVTVTINSSSVGSVAVPFVVPVPVLGGDTGGDDDLESELGDAVSLVVMSDSSGTTANLTSGTIVSGTPSGAGQWNWDLNDMRDRADLKFFNGTANGLTLKSAVSYTATLSITTNDYVKSESQFSFPITVVGN